MHLWNTFNIPQQPNSTSQGWYQVTLRSPYNILAWIHVNLPTLQILTLKLPNHSWHQLPPTSSQYLPQCHDLTLRFKPTTEIYVVLQVPMFWVFITLWCPYPLEPIHPQPTLICLGKTSGGNFPLRPIFHARNISPIPLAMCCVCVPSNCVPFCPVKEDWTLIWALIMSKLHGMVRP